MHLRPLTLTLTLALTFTLTLTFALTAALGTAPLPAAIVPVPKQISPERTAGAKPRNVIFILVDDHRYDAMSFLGHPLAETPHIDSLAKNGVHLKNALVTTALCSPSRASILTGLYTSSPTSTSLQPSWRRWVSPALATWTASVSSRWPRVGKWRGARTSSLSTTGKRTSRSRPPSSRFFLTHCGGAAADWLSDCIEKAKLERFAYTPCWCGSGIASWDCCAPRDDAAAEVILANSAPPPELDAALNRHQTLNP